MKNMRRSRKRNGNEDQEEKALEEIKNRRSRGKGNEEQEEGVERERKRTAAVQLL
jgi:hypothetical protein